MEKGVISPTKTPRNFQESKRNVIYFSWRDSAPPIHRSAEFADKKQTRSRQEAKTAKGTFSPKGLLWVLTSSLSIIPSLWRAEKVMLGVGGG
jgi:hypothetical protein